MGFLNPIIGDGGALVRPAIKSPAYTPGSAGWTINQDGSAEFNDLVLRGVFSGLDYVVSEDGIFFYNGAPAAGTMAGSWAPVDGTDPYGNTYAAGLALYTALGSIFLGGVDGMLRSIGSSGAAVTVADGFIGFDATPETPGHSSAAIEQNRDRGHGSLYLEGGADAPADQAAMLGVVTSYGTPVPGQQDTYPRTSTSNVAESVVAHHYVSGAVVKSSKDGNASEVWHTVGAAGQPAYGAPFAAGSTAGNYQALQYRLDAEDNLHLEGAWHCTASVTSATVLTLPVGNRPTVARAVPVTSDTSAGAVSPTNCLLQFNSNGPVNLHLSTASAVGQNFYVNVKIPLGNLA